MSDSKEKLREARKKHREQAKKLREAEKLAGGQPDAYARHKEDAAERSKAKSKSGRDVGPLPAVVNPERKEACRLDLKLALETYWPNRFPLPWAQDHLDAIQLLQKTILVGGLYALAMYRGGGKTTLCESADEWAHLYGHRSFSVIIGSTGDAATDILSTIKEDLEINDLLYDDFPEVCHPIRALEGIANRCNGQTLNGRGTQLEWGQDEIVLPTVPGAPSSGSIIRVAGITGRIRGIKRGNLRPDLVLLDDPQTDESAASPMGNRKRMRIIQRAALKLAGPKKRIACMMPCTIIFPGDMVDEFTDRNKHPEFNGDRRKLVHAFPTNKKLWDQYREIRADGLRVGDDGKAGTDFYLANRGAMDDGAIIAWPEFTKGKASAVQYVMDEFIDDPDGAAAELNNEPRHAAALTNLRQLSEEDLAVHQNTLPLGVVPRDCNKLTAFIDLGQEVLYATVCAWSDSFGGAVIDYFPFPEQPMPIFESGNVPRPLSALYPTLEEKARIYKAIGEVVAKLSGKSYAQQDGTTRLSISLGMIDSGKWADTVHEFLARSSHKALWRASKGRSIDPNSKPLNEYRKEPGDQVGWNWRIDMKTTAKGRFVSFDTRPWKSQIVNSLLAAPGSATCIYLPGSKLIEHPLLTLHLLSEYRAELIGSLTGRKVEAFYSRPEFKSSGNHYWDCLIGCAVAANVAGLQFSSATAAGEKPEQERPKPVIDARAEYERKRRLFEARRGGR